MWRFVRSPFGLTLRGIRDSESRMRSLGYNVPLHLFIGFTVSGFFAGVAGALYAMFNNFVSPSTVALAQSVEGLLMAIAGGVGTLFGAFVGAAAIIALENVVSAYTERWQMVLGITFILIMIFAPEGIIGKAARHSDAQGALIECFHERSIEMDRRQFLKTTTAALTAAGVGVAPWRSAQAQAGPIKIGLLAPLTGVVASGGGDGRGRAVLSRAGQERDRRPQGRDSSSRTTPRTPTPPCRRRAAWSSRPMCHFLIGNLLANTGLAVANYVKGTGTPYFIPIIAADDLTQRQRIKNVIRVAGYSASEFTHPLGDWALKQGYKKIATISQDYTFGHEQCGGLAQVFTEGGGEIVQQFWHPLNTADFSPYLGQLADLKIDAIFAMETGADATRFIQQYASFGLKAKMPLLGAMNGTDQSVIRTLGEECEGIVLAGAFRGRFGQSGDAEVRQGL